MGKQKETQQERKAIDLDDLENDLNEAVGILGILDAAMNNQYFADAILGVLAKTPAHCQFNQFDELIGKAYEAVERAFGAVSSANA